ncbi:unnamed protein product [Meganyctiphanes norvegica]|uniref:Uncharacterized protein n=1 Tax=Meganyctiphanes norvegica TaxID=48144 RepID=A0AAV2SG23_MEGNR
MGRENCVGFNMIVTQTSPTTCTFMSAVTNDEAAENTMYWSEYRWYHELCLYGATWKYGAHTFNTMCVAEEEGKNYWCSTKNDANDNYVSSNYEWCKWTIDN